MFGNPCPGVIKYLEVKLQCEAILSGDSGMKTTEKAEIGLKTEHRGKINRYSIG